MSSDIQGSSSFQNVMENISSSSSQSGASGTSSSGQQASSQAAAKRAASTQQGENASTQPEATHRKHRAANAASKPSSDASASASITQADASSQALPVLPPVPAVTAPATVVAGVLPLSIPEAQNGGSAAVPVTPTAVSSVSDASLDYAAPGSGLETLPGRGAMAATAAPAMPGSASMDGATSVAMDDNVPFLTTEESATPSSGASSLIATEALPSDGSAVMPLAPNGKQQGTANADAGSAPAAAILPALGLTTNLSKTGFVSGKSALAAVQQSRTIRASSPADHDGKHKATTSSSTGASDDGDGESSSFQVAASDSTSGNSSPSDGQKAPAADLTMAQLQGSVAAQSSSATPHNTPVPTGAENAGDSPAANYTPVSVPGSVTETANLPAINSAQLIQSVRHSEMRLGLQSDEFGSLSISTSVGRQALSAQISTEHLELGRALAVHLPAMEQKLSTAYGLSAKVELNSGTSSSDTASGQQFQGGRQQGGRNNATLLSTAMGASVTTASYTAEAIGTGSSRLDIRI